MSCDNVTVITSSDSITVTDPTTLVPVTISEDVISVGSGVDQINITETSENVSVTEVTESFLVQEVVETIQPNVSDVIINVSQIAEEEVPYAKRVDFVGETIIYIGQASVGQIESAASWRVKRLTLGTDDDVTEEWADGSAAFSKIWDDRASFTYT